MPLELTCLVGASSFAAGWLGRRWFPSVGAPTERCFRGSVAGSLHRRLCEDLHGTSAGPYLKLCTSMKEDDVFWCFLMFFGDDDPHWAYCSRGLQHVETRGPFISSHQRSWGRPVLLVRTFAASVSGGGRLLQRWQQHPHRLGFVAARAGPGRGQTLPGLHWHFSGRCCDVVEQASNWEIKLVAERWLPTALHAIHGEHSETAYFAFNQVVFLFFFVCCPVKASAFIIYCTWNMIPIYPLVI